MAVVIVTGASRGLGFAVARSVIELGGCVVAVARSADDALLDKLAGSPQNAAKSRVAVVPGDITDPSVCDSVVDASLKRFGKVDAVIHNAGALEPLDSIAAGDYGQWKTSAARKTCLGKAQPSLGSRSNRILVVRIRRLFDINLFAVFLLTQKALPHLRKQHGRVVMVSSGAANKAYVGWSAYCCSKAALNMFADNLAAEEPEITSIAVRPGVVETEMQKIIRDSGKKAMRPEDHEFFVGLCRDGRLVAPEQPGHVLAKLAVGPIPKELNGKFVSWDSDELKAFRK